MKEAVAGPGREVIALKQENARLKKLVAEEALVIDCLRDLNETLARGKTNHGGVQGNDIRWRYRHVVGGIHATHVRVDISVCETNSMQAPEG